MELKKSTGELKDGMHSACAFLNTDGGWLFLGIAPTSLKILGQLDGAMAFCFKHLNLSGKVVGLKREEDLEIPYEALREGVINALCHRRYDDYREGLQLGIYDDRVEICNPGRFPTGVTPENIKTLHSSKPRNLHIAQVMYKAAFLRNSFRRLFIIRA